MGSHGELAGEGLDPANGNIDILIAKRGLHIGGGFRRFMMRGLAKVSLEWDLVCLAYNLKRLHRLDACLRTA